MDTEYTKARDAAASKHAREVSPLVPPGYGYSAPSDFKAGADWGRAYESPTVKFLIYSVKRIIEEDNGGEHDWRTSLQLTLSGYAERAKGDE